VRVKVGLTNEKKSMDASITKNLPLGLGIALAILAIYFIGFNRYSSAQETVTGKESKVNSSYQNYVNENAIADNALRAERVY